MGKQSRLKRERRQAKVFAENDYMLNILTSLRIQDEKQKMVFADFTDGFIVPASEASILTREDIVEVKNDTLLNLNGYLEKYTNRMKNYQQFLVEFFDRYGREVALLWNTRGELQARLKWLSDIGYDIEKLR